MDVLFTGFAFLGTLLLYWRLYLSRKRIRETFTRPVMRPEVSPSIESNHVKLSVIVPARNEARTLPRLLSSLECLVDVTYEVIVVDDESTDGTSAVASSLGARVLEGKPLPPGWYGKSWACQQGARVARGEYLLFTDADTWHSPASASSVLLTMEQRALGMASALPYHVGATFWERSLGAFHLLLLAVTRPYQMPTSRRLFAIGQHLMFKADAYRRIGGHASVKACAAEDLALAKRAVSQGESYGALHEPDLYSVRMYETFGGFVRGWRRNFRLGMRESFPGASVDMFLFVCAFTGGGVWSGSAELVAISALCAAASWALVALEQKRHGNFSTWGVLLIPWSLFVLCLVSALAAFDMALGNQLVWKNRSYGRDGTDLPVGSDQPRAHQAPERPSAAGNG